MYLYSNRRHHQPKAITLKAKGAYLHDSLQLQEALPLVSKNVRGIIHSLKRKQVRLLKLIHLELHNLSILQLSLERVLCNLVAKKCF